MRVPVIMFGQLAGQELHNPQLLEAHGLAKYCPDINALPDCVKAMLANGGAEAEAMRAAQRAYAPEDAAAQTAKLIHDWIGARMASKE